MSELRGHSGLVNCLVYSDKQILYAGDSRGQLGVWQEKQGVWQMKKHINIVNVSLFCFNCQTFTNCNIVMFRDRH